MKLTESRWLPGGFTVNSSWKSLSTLTLIAGLALSGCAANRQSGLTSTAAPAAAPIEASLIGEADALWVQREDPAKLRQAIDLYEKALASDPGNRSLAIKVARGTYFLADAYIQDPEEKLAMYDKATFFGERAMALNKDFKAKMDAGAELPVALAALTREDAESAYWTASSLGKWARMKGFSTVLNNKGRIYSMVSRVTELEPELYHAGPARYWGSYYAVAPSFAGGDLNKSLEWFDKAIASAPAFFGHKVLKAELYATKRQDKALFEKLLQEVIDGDPNALADVIPEQKIEQKKARALLDQKADLFAD